jgi:hypothetical protein
MFCIVVVDVRVTEAFWTSPATRGFLETEELTMETVEVVNAFDSDDGGEVSVLLQATRTSVSATPMSCLDTGESLLM